MIDTARSLERQNLRFSLMDIGRIDFTDRFDLVFSNAALHWVKDHGRLLANVQKALRAGGRARFNFAGEGNCASFFTVVREAMALGRFQSCFSRFEWPWHMPTVSQYERLVQKSGFSHTRVWGENADRFFPDAAAMIGWLDQPGLVPFLAVIPEQDKNFFRDFVVERMIEQTRQSDGRCFETFRRINLLALKPAAQSPSR